MLMFKIALPPLLEQAIPSSPGSRSDVFSPGGRCKRLPGGQGPDGSEGEGEIPREEWEQSGSEAAGFSFEPGCWEWYLVTAWQL